jgi:hypothetical protein
MDDRTYSQLLEDRATARRAAQANAQALSERDAELAHARPMANAAHAYCAAVEARRLHGARFEFLARTSSPPTGPRPRLRCRRRM